MVEIREESSTRGDPAAGDGPSTSSSSAPRPNAAITLSEFVSTRRVDCVLFGARVMTLIFCVFFLIPGTGDAENYYRRALLAGAVTYALRLHQRVPAFSFSREFMATLLLEDACHYLMYTVLFVTASPVTMALLPIALYAALHSANFAVTALQATGKGDSPMCTKISALTASQTQNCLGIIACAEIFIVPLLVSLIFVGKASIFMPFVYYRFLTLRYASRRNPYTRQAFYQMRCSLHQISSSPSCPRFAASFIDRAVGFISNLAPAY